MPKYTIDFSGSGAEVSLFHLNKEQKKALKALGKQLDESKVKEIMKIEDVKQPRYDYDRYAGIDWYPPTFRISVYDEDGRLIWESDDEVDLDEVDYEIEEVLFSMPEKNILLVVQKFEGFFKKYALETDGEIDPYKLITNNIFGETKNLIEDLRYDNQELEVVSKGGYKLLEGYEFIVR
jgi:hypothetical protein